VSESLLGHSKITTTMDTYAHPVSELQRAEVNRLAQLLGEPGSDQVSASPAS
jgi:hypothetical protein